MAIKSLAFFLQMIDWFQLLRYLLELICLFFFCKPLNPQWSILCCPVCSSIYDFCKISDGKDGKTLTVVFKIHINTSKMVILAVLCSVALVLTILCNHFYHFSGCAFVTSSRAKGFFQTSWLDLCGGLHISAAWNFHSFSTRPCPQQSNFSRYSVIWVNT